MTYCSPIKAGNSDAVDSNTCNQNNGVDYEPVRTALFTALADKSLFSMAMAIKEYLESGLVIDDYEFQSDSKKWKNTTTLSTSLKVKAELFMLLAIDFCNQVVDPILIDIDEDVANETNSDLLVLKMRMAGGLRQQRTELRNNHFLVGEGLEILSYCMAIEA